MRAWDDSDDDSPIEACISADASVTVNGSPDDTLDGWSFGFMQVQWIETNWAEYRGQSEKEGSLFLQRGRATGRPAKQCRDTVNAGDFFYSPKAMIACAGKWAYPAVITVKGYNDTPGDFFRLRQLNSCTHSVNYLYEAQLEFHFLTVFSARDPDGVFTHLAHFYWNVHWQARFRPSNFANLNAAWNVRLVPGGNARNIGKVILGTPQPSSEREQVMIDALTDPDLHDNCTLLAIKAAESVDPLSDTAIPLDPPAFTPNANRREKTDWSDFNRDV